jgi:polyphosphate kinase 2 (PPK2 family)
MRSLSTAFIRNFYATRACRRPKAVWRSRYRSIRHLERHLHHNGTRIVKFFLNLSKKEHPKRFLQRIDHPKRNWKISQPDIEEPFWLG